MYDLCVWKIDQKKFEVGKKMCQEFFAVNFDFV